MVRAATDTATSPTSPNRRSTTARPRDHPEHVTGDQARPVDVDLVAAAEGDHPLGLRMQRGEVELAALPGAVDELREPAPHPLRSPEAVFGGDHRHRQAPGGAAPRLHLGEAPVEVDGLEVPVLEGVL